MGTGEDSTPSKNPKPVSSSQEVPTTPYPDWSSSMQAYYGAGATLPFFASTVASPTPHPYLWGSQHPLIPPYGTPVPYPAMYPPGGIYAHPSMAMTPATVHTNTELEEKSPEGRDRASAKRVERNAGNAGSAGGKVRESGKMASGSGNDGASQSADSGTEGSSDGTDENPNQQEYTANKKGSFDQMLADGANAQSSGKPGGSVSATNLNIGMDLWNTSSGSASAKLISNPTGTSSAIISAPMIAREGVMPDQWIQDERELKRQKRKQSNRESARRSRLRKQAECEELQARVQTLSSENRNLRDELQRLSEEYEKLTSENSNIKEELTRLCGSEALESLERGGDEGDRLGSKSSTRFDELDFSRFGLFEPAHSGL